MFPTPTRSPTAGLWVCVDTQKRVSHIAVLGLFLTEGQSPPYMGGGGLSPSSCFGQKKCQVDTTSGLPAQRAGRQSLTRNVSSSKSPHPMLGEYREKKSGKKGGCKKKFFFFFFRRGSAPFV